MALLQRGRSALLKYVARADGGSIGKDIIHEAVELTCAQQAELEVVLSAYWTRRYNCPRLLSIRPRHGYESRVVRDGFTSAQYVEWLGVGCDDSAIVTVERNGRPRLTVRARKDFEQTYDLIVPVHSDSHGTVYIDGVVPSGLPGRAKKWFITDLREAGERSPGQTWCCEHQVEGDDRWPRASVSPGLGGGMATIARASARRTAAARAGA